MSLAFRAIVEESMLPGRLLYRIRDHAFDFEAVSDHDLETRIGAQGTGSIALGTLQLEVSIETHYVLYPWGFAPYGSMQTGPIALQSWEVGGLHLMPELPLEEGVALELTGDWRATRDPFSGWIDFSSPRPQLITRNVMFATGCIARLYEDELIGLQVQPTLRL